MGLLLVLAAPAQAVALNETLRGILNQPNAPQTHSRNAGRLYQVIDKQERAIRANSMQAGNALIKKVLAP